MSERDSAILTALIELFAEVKSLSVNEEILSDRGDVKFPGLISAERENDAQNGSSKMQSNLFLLKF